MGNNKKENFIFVLMICSTMVFIMSCYNIALIEGFSLEIFKHALFGFPAAFIFALIGDTLIIGKIVKKIIPNFVKPNDSMKKKGIFMSLFTCCGMVIWMSFYGTVTNVGFIPYFLKAYGMGMVKNVVFALPMLLIVVLPIIRCLFFKLFPPIINNNLNTQVS